MLRAFDSASRDRHHTDAARRRTALGLALLLAVAPLAPVRAEATRIAVASNFAAPARALASRLDARGTDGLVLVFGSTGKLYAQIENGAPFHAFLAADAERPRRLAEAGRTAGGPFTYAIGRLVLWSPREGLVDPEGNRLRQQPLGRVALANPRLAPYGKAARETLTTLGLWQSLSGRMVFGENIGQTFHFVSSGNAELGFVAFSQIKNPVRPARGSYWEVPPSHHEPIEQRAVLVRDDPGARAFLDFLKGPEGRSVIESFGYGTP